MFSDDTEHTLLVAQALCASAGETTAFTKSLARGLRRWICLLTAGTGKATAQAALRLLIGASPERSGVWSAGNGPAMRAALLGVCYGDDINHLHTLVQSSSRITHTDPKATYGALAVAHAAHLSASGTLTPETFLATLPLPHEAEELRALLNLAAKSAADGETSEIFAAALGLEKGVSGYIYHTVPVAIHAALRHPQDYAAAIQSVIACGGDTDTTAAIVGGIVGANVGPEGIPVEWRQGLAEWPCNLRWMERLAAQLAEVVRTGQAQPPLQVPAIAVLLRNLGFLGVVLYHGLRRLRYTI